MKYLTVLATTGLGLALTTGLLAWIAERPTDRFPIADIGSVAAPCDQGPRNAPTYARDDLDETAADWGAYCENSPTWTITNVTTPALDGKALECALTGGAPYSNVHCYRNFLAEPTATAFTLTLTLSFQFTPTTTCNNAGAPSVVQALEFSMSRWQTGVRHEFALQWQNVGQDAPRWRYWDPSRPEAERWVAITPTIAQCLQAGQWYTLTIEGDVVAGQTHYQRFSVNGVNHPLDVTVPPVPAPGAPDAAAIAVQLDGSAAASPYRVFLDQVSFNRQCGTLYNGGANGWLVDMCEADPSVGATMQVVVDGAARGNAALVRVYHQSQAWPGQPQVAALYASGFVRLKPNADPSPAIPFGSSFILGPAYWAGGAYYHSPQLNRLEIDTTWLPTGPLRLLAWGTNQGFDVFYEMALPPPRDRQTRLHVTQTYTATTAIAIDPGRRANHEGFKLAQISSMFVNQGGACDGGNSDCHDSNGARFIGNDLVRHQVAFTEITPSAFVFSAAVPLGSTWLDALHTDDASWQGNTPNVHIALDVLPGDRTLTPQGWISATTDPNQDNVGLWLHDDGLASQSWAADQSGQIGYWLLAQDNPPDPWADLGLRPGLTFLDFEGSYNCFFVKDSGQPTTGMVSTVAGYADTALQLTYDIGAANGNWAQVRCNFNPPLDLSTYDHLRFEWRGDPGASSSLEVGVVITSAGQEYIFGRGYHHPAHRGWWGQMVIPFNFLAPWTPGTVFTPTQVSAIFFSVVKDPVDDAGGAGRLALDNLGAFNVLSRTVPLTFELNRGNDQASRRAASWLASQQQPSGLLKSWEKETLCNAHTYDQALALIVFAVERRWPQADALANALTTTQNANGSWFKSRNCDTLAPVDSTEWEGDIAWAIYALSRYRALGGALSGADTAIRKGADWLAQWIRAEDGCLVVPDPPRQPRATTEGTLDAWWAFHSAGPDYADEADKIRVCLLTKFWDDAMGRFQGGLTQPDGTAWQQPYLDNQTWGAAFLKAIGEEAKARRALSYARDVLRLPAQGGPLFGFDGQGGPWSVWNEGTGQYIALCGEGADDLLLELLAQQRADGAMPGSPDDFSGGGVWTTRWHGVAPTAWLYNALNGEPFDIVTKCASLYLPLVVKD